MITINSTWDEIITTIKKRNFYPHEYIDLIDNINPKLLSNKLFIYDFLNNVKRIGEVDYLYDLLSRMGNELKKDKSFALMILKKYKLWETYDLFDISIKTDEDIMKAILEIGHIDFDWFENPTIKEIFTNILSQNEELLFLYLKADFCNDTFSGEFYSLINKDKLFSTKEICIKIIKNCGGMWYEEFSDDIKNDKEIIFLALNYTTDPYHTFGKIKSNLRNNKSIAMIAVSKEPRCIDFLSPTLREDKDIKKTINQVYEKLALEVSAKLKN